MTRSLFAFMFLINGIQGLSCIDTKSLYQSEQCCETPLKDVSQLCVTGTAKSLSVGPLSSTVTMEWEADKPDSISEADRADSLILPAVAKAQVLADLSYRPEGCGELCSTRSVRFVFKRVADYSAFIEWMTNHPTFAGRVFETHKLHTIRVITSTSAMTDVKAAQGFLDSLSDLHKTKQETGIAFNYNTVEDSSFDRRCWEDAA
jgi:hypothetical protein